MNEVAGLGNHNTAPFWEYDTRLGRRWNLDPKPQISISDYAANGNNPIINTDKNGDFFVFWDRNNNTGKGEYFVITNTNDLEKYSKVSDRASQLNLMMTTLKDKGADPNNMVSQLLNSKDKAVFLSFTKDINLRAGTGFLRETRPDLAKGGYENAVAVSGLNLLKGQYSKDPETGKIGKHSPLVTFVHEMKHAFDLSYGLRKSSQQLKEDVDKGKITPTQYIKAGNDAESAAMDEQNKAAEKLGEDKFPCYDCESGKFEAESPVSTQEKIPTPNEQPTK